MKHQNYGLKGAGKCRPADEWATLARQLTSASIRENEYVKWYGVLAFLYVEMGLDEAEHHGSWGVD